MQTRRTMTKIKVETPDRSETPSSSEENDNSQSSSDGRKHFGVVTNSNNIIKRKNSKHHPIFVSLNGIQSSVPTVTTPTLTPSTLRNIEQDLYELTSDTGPPPPYLGGFVPPPAQTSYHITGDNDYSNSNHSNGSDSEQSWNNSYDDNSSLAANDTEAKYSVLNSSYSPQGDVSSISGTHSERKPRGQGGRRPTKSANLSPEEEEKRRVRRERNKQAAARCRKRRVDQTNDLCEKVQALENIKTSLENEVRALNEERASIEQVLREHNLTCKLQVPGRLSPFEVKPKIPDILDAVIKTEPKEEFDDDLPSAPKRALLNDASFYIPTPEEERTRKLPTVSTIMTTLSTSLISPSVPLTPLNTPTMIAKSLGFPTLSNQLPLLNISNSTIINNNNTNQKSSKPRPNSLNVEAPPRTINGISIQTPSNGNFNFDSLMDGRTGLTPVMPTSQSLNNPLQAELNTPTTNSTSDNNTPQLASL